MIPVCRAREISGSFISTNGAIPPFSFEETGTSPSAEKKLPRERCKVNLLEISRTRRICRNYRLLGKHADKVRAVQRWSTGGKSSAIVLHSFLETRVVTSPRPVFPAFSFLFFSIPFAVLPRRRKSFSSDGIFTSRPRRAGYGVYSNPQYINNS